MIILHLSAFAVPANAQPHPRTGERPKATDGSDALKDFLAVMADTNSQIVVYSRVVPKEESAQRELMDQLAGTSSDLARRPHSCRLMEKPPIPSTRR